MAHYVEEGVDELDQEKLSPLPRLRYGNSLSNAVTDLGQPEQITQVFTGVQQYRYQPPSAAT